MIATWMLYGLLVGGLIALAARAVEEACRAARLGLRFVWLGALVVTVGLVGLAPLRGSAPAPVVDGSVWEAGSGSAAPEAAIADEAAAPSTASRARAAVRRAPDRALRLVAPLGEGRAGALLALGWIALSMALVGAGVATVLRSFTARRRWPLGELAGNAVRVSPASGPAVVGVLRPEIVVPRWLLAAPEEMRRLAVLHEAEHVRARDPIVLAAGCLCAALVPWNPALWWMLRRLRLAVELDCDRRVLHRGVEPFAYGSLLIDVTGRLPGERLGAAVLAASSSTLERRLIAMSRRLPRFAAARATGGLSLALAAAVIACDARMPTTAEVEAMDATAAESQARQFGLLRAGDDAIYFVDGDIVDPEVAAGVAPDRIARIQIIRARDGGSPLVQIRTRDASEGDALTESGRVAITQGALAGDVHLQVTRQLRLEGAPVASVSPGPDFEGLLLIDGAVADAAELGRMVPSRIETVEVLKGEAAARLYDDPRAEYGVIRIKTRRSGSER